MRVMSVEPVVCRWPPVLRILAAHLSRSPFCFAPQILKQKRDFSQWVIFRRKTGSLVTLMIRVCYVAVATGKVLRKVLGPGKVLRLSKKRNLCCGYSGFPLSSENNFQTLIQLGLW